MTVCTRFAGACWRGRAGLLRSVDSEMGGIGKANF